MEQRIFGITTSRADPAPQWRTAPGIDEAYLSGASLHAVVPADSPSTTGDCAYLVAAGFDDALVAEVDPTIEDVFVNLESRQR